MRTILALSLAAFAFAVPVAQPQSGVGADLSAFCLNQYALFTSLIDLT